MFGRIRAEYREATAPHDVVMGMTRGQAREIFAFQAWLGKTNGTAAWLGLLVFGMSGLMFMLGALIAGPDPIWAVILGGIVAYGCLVVLLIVPWWVKRQIRWRWLRCRW